MKWASFLSKAIMIAGLAGLGLIPLQAHDQHRLPQNAGASPLLKFADGNRILQRYVQPSQEVALPANGPVPFNLVQSLSEKQVPLGEAGFKLRPRLVTRLRGAVQALLQRQPVMNARAVLAEKLAVFDFDVLYGELPVVNASRTVLVSGGRTVAIRDRNPPHGLAKPVMPPQTAPANLAWAVAAKNSTATLSRLYPGKAHRLTADPKDPNARLVLWPDERARQLHLAWALTVRSTSKSEPFMRRYWVSASQPGRILDFEDLIFHAQQPPAPDRAPALNPFGSFLSADTSRPKVTITDWPAPGQGGQRQHTAAPTTPGRAPAGTPTRSGGGHTAVFNGTVSGTVTGSMWESSPYSAVVTRPLSGVEITVIRASGLSSVAYSDGSGRYNVSGVNGLATVNCTLSGPSCKINNEAAKDDVNKFSSRVGRNGTIDIDFLAGPSDEYKLAQNSGYYAVDHAFEFVKGFLPDRPTKLPRITTNVNIDSSCNAYYDRGDTSLNFFRSFAATGNSNEKSCPNTAYRDVIYHEYGHAVDDELGGILDGAYSEGFGDCLSILITHSPLVGTDFYGPGQNLRDARKVYLWSKVKDSEIHEAGQAYSGFCWELTRQLQRTYGEAQAYEIATQLIMGAAAQNPKDIPDAVRLSFFLDGKLFPGSRAGESRHAAQLRAAAQSRQLPIPSDSNNLASPAVN